VIAFVLFAAFGASGIIVSLWLLAALGPVIRAAVFADRYPVSGITR
jgi:hypothetical protein